MADNQQSTGISRTRTTVESVPVPWNLINLAPDADGHEVLAARLAGRELNVSDVVAEVRTDAHR